ncbi:MAG: DUF5117 domain-containing protein, partial [Holophagales bacterium]|nr:DUF5117 domain-containing protein [Holophagales bacterium]
MKHLRTVLIMCLVLCLSVAFAVAQDAPKKDEAKAEKPAKEQAKPDKKKEKPKFKKYEEVITKKAVTKGGVFTTHMVDDKLYFEIPAEQFDREFIWVTQYSKVQTGNGWAGMPITTNTVRWQRRGDQVYLRLVNYRLRAERGTPEAIAVEASSQQAIVAAFKIVTFAEMKGAEEGEEKEKEGEEKKKVEHKTPVIEVTDFFLGDVTEFSPKRALRAANLDKKRSYISSVKSFPKNIETRVLATFARRPNNNQPGGGFFGGASNSPTVTVEIHHSMVALPDRPMRARIHDPRVGFFAGSFEDYTKGVDGIELTTYISRWRLEKKDPNAKLS